MSTLTNTPDKKLRHYDLAFRVLERIDSARDLTTFKEALTTTLANVYGVRSTTFFVGPTSQLACADPNPVITGFTRHMLPEYQEMWFQNDIFTTFQAVRSFTTTRVSTLFEINSNTVGTSNRRYVTDYLQRHETLSATALCLDVNDGHKALVGLFDRNPERVGPHEVASLRLLANPLTQIARNLPERYTESPTDNVLSRLSSRQAEVVRLVAEGLSNAAIGEILHLDPTSVKKYITRILATCGLQTRVELALAVHNSEETRRRVE